MQFAEADWPIAIAGTLGLTLNVPLCGPFSEAGVNNSNLEVDLPGHLIRRVKNVVRTSK